MTQIPQILALGPGLDAALRSGGGFADPAKPGPVGTGGDIKAAAFFDLLMAAETQQPAAEAAPPEQSETQETESEDVLSEADDLPVAGQDRDLQVAEGVEPLADTAVAAPPQRVEPDRILQRPEWSADAAELQSARLQQGVEPHGEASAHESGATKPVSPSASTGGMDMDVAQALRQQVHPLQTSAVPAADQPAKALQNPVPKNGVQQTLAETAPIPVRDNGSGQAAADRGSIAPLPLPDVDKVLAYRSDAPGPRLKHAARIEATFDQVPQAPAQPHRRESSVPEGTVDYPAKRIETGFAQSMTVNISGASALQLGEQPARRSFFENAGSNAAQPRSSTLHAPAADHLVRDSAPKQQIPPRVFKDDMMTEPVRQRSDPLIRDSSALQMAQAAFAQTKLSPLAQPIALALNNDAANIGPFEDYVTRLDGTEALPRSDRALSATLHATPQIVQIETRGAWEANAPRLTAAIMSLRETGGQIDVSLSPEDLGRLTIKLEPTSGAVSVTLLAERPETQDLIKRHFDLLQEQLAQMGMGDLEFSFAGGKEGPSPESPHADQGADDLSAAAPSHQINAVPRAADSGLDIRI